MQGYGKCKETIKKRNSMKIGIYDPYLDTLAGGEKYMLTFATCLAKNHTVSLFWHTDDKEKIKESAKKRLGIDLSNVHIADNLFSTSVPFYKRLLESRKYDAVIVLSDGSFPLLMCPLILHFQSPLEWIKGKTIKNKIKLARVKNIICNSQFTKSFIDKELSVFSTVIYPPVDVSHTFISTDKKNIILNVGRFGIKTHGSSYKKQEELIDVFNKMVTDGLVDWELVFVMSYKKDQQTKFDIFKESIEGFPIKIIENPSNEVLWEIYKKSKIYWHAAGFGEDIQKDPDRAEHFGIATVEAMSVGSVPIVIKMGGQVEIVENGENGLFWETKEELIRKTNQVIKDNKLWKTLSENAIKRAKDFSQEKFCERISNLFT